MSEADFANLALHAQTRNETLGICGLLFVADNRAIQILEGEKGPVTWLYEQIKADTRHTDVVTLFDGAIDHRDFDGWAMRLVGVDDLSTPERLRVLAALRADYEARTAKEAAANAALNSCTDDLRNGVFRRPHAMPAQLMAAG